MNDKERDYLQQKTHLQADLMHLIDEGEIDLDQYVDALSLIEDDYDQGYPLKFNHEYITQMKHDKRNHR